ncbi:UDP-N-acetylmuramoyl-L-alanine--D-glutamate ligase [Persephonella sp.]
MILIFGKGKTGKSLEKLIKSLNLKYEIRDDKDIKYSHLNKYSEIIVSPGIPFHHKIFKKSKELKIPIYGEVEFAYRYFKNRIIAVTGTDGKSTTTKLIQHLIGVENIDIGGNYGIPFSEIVLKNKSVKPTVLELSSFQIYTLKNFNADIGVFLNLYPDHLDWHKRFLHYRYTKYKLFKKVKNAVLNFDSKYIKNCPSPEKKYYFSLEKLPENIEGAYISENNVNFVFKKDRFSLNLEDIPIKGIHNLQNIMASVITAYIFGIKPDDILERLKSFKPLPHRMEYIGSKEGVSFYNDSKATTVQSVKMALKSFPEKRVILIAGGIYKGGNFSDLKDELSHHVKKVILIGRDKQKIYNEIKHFVTDIENTETLENAVNIAFKSAEKGDVVLLSPGCSSFDMFKNFEERGLKFIEAFRNLNNG